MFSSVPVLITSPYTDHRPDSQLAASGDTDHRSDSQQAASGDTDHRSDSQLAASGDTDHRPDSQQAASGDTDHRPDSQQAASGDTDHRPPSLFTVLQAGAPGKTITSVRHNLCGQQMDTTLGNPLYLKWTAHARHPAANLTFPLLTRPAGQISRVGGVEWGRGGG